MPCKLWSDPLYQVIQEIKLQTFQPDAIYLSIPLRGRRDGLEYILPQWLKDDKDVTVLWSPEDLGPLTKLLPTLIKEQHPETRIVTMDDDWRYPETMIQQMIEWSLEYPDAGMSYTNGWNATCLHAEVYNCLKDKHGRYRYYVMTQPPHDNACTSDWRWIYGLDMCAAQANTTVQPVHVIQGVGGNIFRRGSFPRDFFDLGGDKWPKNHCYFNDDIWVSGQFAKAGRQRYVMPQKYLPPNPVFVDGRKPREIAPWKFKAREIKSFDSFEGDYSKDMPIDKTKCSTELHGDRNFLDHNLWCSKFFSDYFDEDSRVNKFWYEEPDKYFVKK